MLWPATGKNDERYTLEGFASEEKCRIWPGFRSERTVVVNRNGEEDRFRCVCSIKETPKGPLFVVTFTAEVRPETITVAG